MPRSVSSQIILQPNGAVSIQGTCLMGILNRTPDSFSDGGKYKSLAEIVKVAQQFVEWGVSLLDVGGESSRPGANPVSVQEELDRVIPVIEALHQVTDVYLSIDTTKSEVAQEALQAGAHFINDISACRQDPKMWEVARHHPLILMHMQGEPRTMQEHVHYENVVEDVAQFFEERLQTALQKGLSQEQILLDPGIGFGKHLEHNLLILKYLDRYFRFQRPLVVGASRKSFLGKILDAPVQERLMGDSAITAYCALKGVSLLRVHDVYQMQQVLNVISAIEQIDLNFPSQVSKEFIQ